VAVTGLNPGDQYALWLVNSRTPPFGQKAKLATFKTNLAGAQIVQTVGPLRQVLTGAGDNAEQAKARFLLITRIDGDAAELIQSEGNE
jgi:hypothetical protein